MTQQKKSAKLKQAQPAPDLRQNFLKLSADDQQKVTNFFNMHNCAVYLFSTMSQEAQQYTQYCISLSQEADKTEEKNV